jgi:hypothetical protein
MTGIRRTNSSDTYNVLVEAYHNIADGEIDRVEFAISVNGSSVGTQTVSSRQMWLPNDSTYTDPLPGNWGGGPAPLWCYGYSLLMSDYSAGYIDIVPTVYATSGESVTLETIRVYNDSDGTDRRPCTGIAYWDYNSGSDTNTGLTTGSPVKTFQKALEVIASSNDVGGGIVYVNAAGVHKLGSRNAYSFGANLFTGGHHWVTVMPKAGLTRDDVHIARISNFDGDWMTFSGTTAGQSARLRISDCCIDLPGITVSGGSNITLSIWTEHVKFAPPSPFNQHPNNGEGAYIRIYDYSGSGVGLNAAGPRGTWFSTGCERSFGVFGTVGEKSRGSTVDSCIGVMTQFNNDNEAHTNLLTTNIYQNYGISGYFAQTTTSLSISGLGGNSYKVEANAPYSGPDFAEAARYLTGSSSLGILLADFPTSANNVTWAVTGFGYTSSRPYVVITGAGIVAETYVSGKISPGKFGDTTTWEVFGPHSDVVQVNVGGLKNLIYSNAATYKSWQTQGIFSNGNSVSGMAIVNMYDGDTTINTTRSYLVGSYNKHLLFRNATIDQMEVLSTQTLEDCEIIDCVFNNFEEFNGIGSTTTYASLVDTRYNHFIDSGDAVGTNTSTGMFFALATPSESTGAYASVSSYGYGTASSLWETPSNSMRTLDKGAWENVSTADWSIPLGVSITGGVLVSTSSSPNSSIHITSNTPLLYSLGKLKTSSPATSLFLGSTISSPSYFSGSAEIKIPVTALMVSGSLPVPGLLIEQPPALVTASAPAVTVSVIINIPNSSVSSATFDTSVSPTATGGTGAVILLSTVTTVEATAPEIDFVIGIQNPTGNNSPTIIAPRQEYTNGVPIGILTIEAQSPASDLELKEVMSQLVQVRNNITSLPVASQGAWSQKVIGNINKNTIKTVINIMTSEYQNFAKRPPREAAIFRNNK